MVPPIEYEQAHTPNPKNNLSTIRGKLNRHARSAGGMPRTRLSEATPNDL